MLSDGVGWWRSPSLSDQTDRPTSEAAGLPDAAQGRIAWQPDVARSAMRMTTRSARHAATAGVARHALAWYQRLAGRLRSATAGSTSLPMQSDVDSEMVAVDAPSNALHLVSLHVASSDNGSPVRPRLLTSVTPAQPRREVSPWKLTPGAVVVHLDEPARAPLTIDEIPIKLVTRTQAVLHDRAPVEDQQRIASDHEVRVADQLTQRSPAAGIELAWKSETHGTQPMALSSNPTAHSILASAGGFAEFIEHLDQPVAVPGLELSPHPLPHSAVHLPLSAVHADVVPDRALDHPQRWLGRMGPERSSQFTPDSTSATVGPPARPGAPQRAPLLPDIDVLADHVAERLRRRERAERERRGTL